MFKHPDVLWNWNRSLYKIRLYLLYQCNKYKYVFAPGTLGILPGTYLVSVSHVMGLELGISMPYEYMWGLSMEQRGTTDLTIYTAFIHIKTSLTAYITSQCMIGKLYELHSSPVYSLWRELTTVSFININNIIKYSVIIITNHNNI